jgi:hypothetical protein
MDKSFYEQNSALIKPIFQEAVTLACAKTVHIRQQLEQEQKTVTAKRD